MLMNRKTTEKINISKCPLIRCTKLRNLKLTKKVNKLLNSEINVSHF